MSCMRRQLTANVGTNNAREMAKPRNDRKAKADTGTQHGREAVSCPKAIGHD